MTLKQGCRIINITWTYLLVSKPLKGDKNSLWFSSAFHEGRCAQGKKTCKKTNKQKNQSFLHPQNVLYVLTASSRWSQHTCRTNLKRVHQSHHFVQCQVWRPACERLPNMASVGLVTGTDCILIRSTWAHCSGRDKSPTPCWAALSHRCVCTCRAHTPRVMRLKIDLLPRTRAGPLRQILTRKLNSKQKEKEMRSGRRK